MTKHMLPEHAAKLAELDAAASGKYRDWVHAAKLWRIACGECLEWSQCLEMAALCEDAE